MPALLAVTGSVRAGQEIAAAAAADLKRVHLELGGNAPVIVHDDVDVEATAAELAPSRTTTPARTAPPPPGSCAPRGVYDAFVAAFAAHAALRTAPGTADYGPLNSAGSTRLRATAVDRLPPTPRS